MRKCILGLTVLAIAGCAPGTAKQGVGFGTAIGGSATVPAATAPRAQNLVAAPQLQTSPRADLPYHAGQSRSFRKKNKPVSVRSAAIAATSVGAGFLTAPERKSLVSGNTRVGLRQVRYDTHDFVIATYQGQVDFKSIWAGGINRWSPDARKLANAHAPCPITDGYHKFGGNAETAIIFVMSC